MAIYSVFEPLEKDLDPDKQADNILFAKEGFSVWAYAFPPIFFLARRMWVVLGAYLAVVALFILLWKMSGLSEIVFSIAMFGLNFLAGLESRNLYQLSLEKSGYELRDVIVGSSLAECEQTFFSKWDPSAAPNVGDIETHAPSTRFGISDGGATRGGSRHSAIGALGGD